MQYGPKETLRMKTIFTSYFAASQTMLNTFAITVRKPRWCPDHVQHFPALAPSQEMLDDLKSGKISQSIYAQHYQQKLEQGKLTAEEIVNLLPDRAILLCYERKGQFCHRHLAVSWLQNNVRGLIVKEL